MGRSLIVANQTLGGAKLERAVRDRIERGDTQFYVVVPMTLPQHEAPAWTGGFLDQGVMPERVARELQEEQARRQEALLDEARRRSEDRLGQMIDKVRSAGGEVDGKVGDADPVVAVKDVLHERSFDEVIISTLPAGISRWLKMDLPSRVSRLTEAPVTTIEADA